MNFFDHKDLGNHLLQLCPKVVKHHVYNSPYFGRTADEFSKICKMTNCIGGRDGKHCLIKCPPNTGFLYSNYKSFHSVNLLGVFGTSCCLTLIDVVAHGHANDNSVFINSSFGKAFSSGDLNVPPIRNIPGTSINIPLYFVGMKLSPWSHKSTLNIINL